MNGKQSKKLRGMAKMFCELQPADMMDKKTKEQIYTELKIVHKTKHNGKSKTTSTPPPFTK